MYKNFIINYQVTQLVQFDAPEKKN